MEYHPLHASPPLGSCRPAEKCGVIYQLNSRDCHEACVGKPHEAWGNIVARNDILWTLPIQKSWTVKTSTCAAM